MSSPSAASTATTQRRRGRGRGDDPERRQRAVGLAEALDLTLASINDDGLRSPDAESCAEVLRAVPPAVPTVPSVTVVLVDAETGEQVEAEPPRAPEGFRLLPLAEGASEAVISLVPPVVPVKYAIVGMRLVFAPDTTWEEWERDVLRLIEVRRRIEFALGDALAFGEGRWGERASQVLEATGFAEQTLKNLATVSRKIPPEDRRPTLAWSVQEAAAFLEPADRNLILDQAEANNWNREETREQVRKVKRLRAREEAEQKPMPPPPSGLQAIEAADATVLPLEDGSINLILTSPPYGIEDPTGETGGERKYRVDDDYRRWLELMADFLDEAWRVLAPQGRLVVNLPIDTWVGADENGGMRPVAAMFLQLALSREEPYTYVTEITWNEGTISKSVARGSVDSPASPRVINRGEKILVLCKGKYQRSASGLTTDLTHDEWLELTDGTWDVPGESSPWEGFGAAWPPEIPTRILKLYSFKEDRVCDPFLGSGTTALAAWRLGRAGFFSDIDEQQVASARRRLLAAGASA